MSNKGLNIDTHQLEELSAVLAAFPDEVNSSLVSCIKSATLTGLKKHATEYYNIKSNRLSGTYRIVAKPTDATMLFEIVGRRLSFAHFYFRSGKRNEVSPIVEVIRGRRLHMGKVDTINGERMPFSMLTGSQSKEKFPANIFVETGKKMSLVERIKSGHRETIRAMRTISAPQMFTNPIVGDKITEETANAFNDRLFKMISNRTGALAENIRK